MLGGGPKNGSLNMWFIMSFMCWKGSRMKGSLKKPAKGERPPGNMVACFLSAARDDVSVLNTAICGNPPGNGAVLLEQCQRKAESRSFALRAVPSAALPDAPTRYTCCFYRVHINHQLVMTSDNERSVDEVMNQKSQTHTLFPDVCSRSCMLSVRIAS